MRKLAIFDTTLRDGSQGEGIAYSPADKIRICEKLDELGIDFIEGGFPGSNPKDSLFFSKISKRRLKTSSVVAFGSTRRPGIKPAKDRNLLALSSSGIRFATIFGKTWLLHVKEVLRTDPDENLRMISDSISFLKSKGINVFYDAEHFFDAYSDNPGYAIKCLRAAMEAGATYLVLCDTNGGTLPQTIASVVAKVAEEFQVKIGIHCHNDCGLAVANSLEAVKQGALMVQGTINGYGERCGNADILQIIANLQLKMGIPCIPEENLKKLTEVSHFVSEVSNMKHANYQPFVGDSAFAHKGGIHINAVMKDTRSYEHIDPSVVGNQRRVLMSELGGKSSILTMAQELKLDLSKNDARLKKIHKLLQELELKGYHFEAAEASFELILKRALHKFKEFFKLEGFRIVVNKDAKGEITTEAIMKLRVNGHLEHTAADGDGPVNALDNALRKALKDFYPELSKMHLADFKVRVLEEKAGTAAKVRVLIQSQDEKDDWNTIGVSENIIEASWQALVDSIEYKLLKDSEE